MPPGTGHETSTVKRNRSPAVLAVLVAALIVAGTSGYLFLRDDVGSSESERTLAVRACEVPVPILERVKRGYVPGRSGDVLTIERYPNLYGNRHSTPFPYTQNVPLVLYGPGFIRRGFTSDRNVTLADIAPTYAELLGFEDFPRREGRPLDDALLPVSQRNGVPKLIFTLVWDGGGDDLLDQWPKAWPELKSLRAEGASYSKATVGSSPSITPAIHATIGTGAFPQTHGLPDIRMRVKGEIVDAYDGTSPKFLWPKTLADLWDAANDNAPLVGMLARDSWHLGMIGHGAFLPEGDRDIAVLDALGRIAFHTNERYYTMPDYVDLGGLEEAVAQLDQRDGAADARWLGNPLIPEDGKIRYTPAWPVLQTQKVVEIIRNEGFGRDDVPDLFFTNYKTTDLAGHEWNLVEPEVRDALRGQDAEIPVLIDALDRMVGKRNYVLALTADHGITPYPEVLGGWPINTREMTTDLERELDRATPRRSLVLANRGYQIMLDRREMRRNGVTARDVAQWVRAYRLGENVPRDEDVTGSFVGREDERLYLTALTPNEVEDALACARSRAG
jgi:predicted AlkP superfamily pyrophosphatase or phosphodiesterase